MKSRASRPSSSMSMQLQVWGWSVCCNARWQKSAEWTCIPSYSNRHTPRELQQCGSRCGSRCGWWVLVLSPHRGRHGSKLLIEGGSLLLDACLHSPCCRQAALSPSTPYFSVLHNYNRPCFVQYTQAAWSSSMQSLVSAVATEMTDPAALPATKR